MPQDDVAWEIDTHFFFHFGLDINCAEDTEPFGLECAFDPRDCVVEGHIHCADIPVATTIRGAEARGH